MKRRSTLFRKALTALLLVGPLALPAEAKQPLALRYNTEGQDLRRAFVPVAERAKDSVLTLQIDGRPVALGTVVGSGGLVLTKASELVPIASDDGPPAGPGELSARLRDGQMARAERLAVIRAHDLALVRVYADTLRPVTWAEPVRDPIGRWMVVPGRGELPEAVGVYSAVPREVTGVRLGIRFGQSDRGPMIGYAIPRMGAADAGLEPGDIIRAIAQQPTPTVDDVIDTIRDVNAGDVVPVLIERNGQLQTFAVEMRLRQLDLSNRADHLNTMGNDVSRRRDGFPSVFQHDAAIDPHRCGGPVLNLDGEAVGINIARAGRIETYALPVDVVRGVLAELEPPQLIHGPDAKDPATPTR
ncbi:MAG: trypsin-like peptidase domain-containing protein [Planctomycetota bacterium]